MKSLLLFSAIIVSAASATELPSKSIDQSSLQFTGRVFTLAANDPLEQIKPPGKIGYTALILDNLITTRTDIGGVVTTDRVQFVLEDGEEVPNGTRGRLDCGFVMGAETHHHFEPLFCGQSKLSIIP